MIRFALASFGVLALAINALSQTPPNPSGLVLPSVGEDGTSQVLAHPELRAFGPGQAPFCQTRTDTQFTMAVLSPCSPNVVSLNHDTTDVRDFAPNGIAISDSDATVLAIPFPVVITAPGMVNVEVWTHGTLATRLTNVAGDIFTGLLDLSNTPAGPLNVRFIAYNSPPGDSSYTVNLNANLDLFVLGRPEPVGKLPVGAAGMTLTWSDEFNRLSAAPCKPNTGIWPNCTKPTAADGFTWYENTPGGGDFGDAAFEHTDSPYNPFKIRDGFLRIRSTYDASFVDPYGYGRHWYSGILGSAFPDGTTNVPILQNGYYESRILTPNSYAGDKDQSGGTWPAFWMLNLESLQPNQQGGLEEDVIEEYGEDPFYAQATEHAYGDAINHGYIYAADPGPDLTLDFHRYGLQVTSTTVTFYFDDVPLGSIAKGEIPNLSTPYWYVLLDLAMGGGWPDNAPPANYYDMWIDYVRYYAPITDATVGLKQQ